MGFDNWVNHGTHLGNLNVDVQYVTFSFKKSFPEGIQPIVISATPTNTIV